MIIRDTEHEFIMTAQHDHAELSGHVARNLKRQFFIKDGYIDDVIKAVYEHDRGWIRMDASPIWNDRTSEPFSFGNYPLYPKLVLYRLGIDEVEQINPYAALLSSLHYCSFSVFHGTTDKECLGFFRFESERQTKLRKVLSNISDGVIEAHLQLLQLCDHISLYVALNHPGVSKEDEHPWYKSGFNGSQSFHPNGSELLIANWIDVETIRITPSPFVAAFQTCVRTKVVPKALVRQAGIQEAYRVTGFTEQLVKFC